METKIISYLSGEICPSFVEWAEEIQLPYIEETCDSFVTYIVDKEHVFEILESGSEDSYLLDLKKAFLENESFERIVLS